MITPIVSFATTQTRGQVDEPRISSSSAVNVDQSPSINREASSALLPVQVISVSVIAEEVTPAEKVDAEQAARPTGADNSSTNPATQQDSAKTAMIRELAQRDREVRQHEMAHKSAAGSAAGAISYDYQRGPDGRLYAVGGEVDIRLSPPSSDPAEMQRYAEQILRAALAPAEPSGQDRQVAAQARAMIAEAQSLASQSSEQQTRERSPDESEQSVAESLPSSAEAEGIEFQQARFSETRARTAESLAEFQQTMNEVSERIAEVNQRLVELGVLDETYQKGLLLSESA